MRWTMFVSIFLNSKNIVRGRARRLHLCKRKKWAEVCAPYFSAQRHFRIWSGWNRFCLSPKTHWREAVYQDDEV
jgi:hypothetical protein